MDFRMTILTPIVKVHKRFGWSKCSATGCRLRAAPNEAAALMKPANEDVLVSRPVNKAVGNVKNNGPELLA